MTKFLLLFFLSSCMYAQIIEFEDINFKNCLLQNHVIDTNQDGEIDISEAFSYTGTIECSDLGIQDLSGFEAFSNVTHLDIRGSNLTFLDLTSNPALTRVNCANSNLQSLDVSQNINLNYLDCNQNQLDEVDVSNNPNLTVLLADSNNLTEIDLSQNTLLEYINIGFNNITNFDFSFNLDLYFIQITNNPIEFVDVTPNTELKFFRAENTLISELNFAVNDKLQHLELSNNTFLESVDIANGSTSSVLFLHADVGCENLSCIKIDDGFSPGFAYDWEVNENTTVSSECLLSVSDFIEQENITIYPNPVTGILNIRTDLEIEKILLYNAEGKLLNTFTPLNQLSLKHLPKGVYYLIFNTPKSTLTKRILKNE